MFKNSLAPRPIKIAVLLGTIEAALVALYGVMLIAIGIVQEYLPIANSLMLGGFFILIALTLIWAVRMLAQGKSSGRSLLLVWQLFIVIIGVQLILGGQWLLGLLALVMAAPTILLLFASESSRYIFAMTEKRQPTR